MDESTFTWETKWTHTGLRCKTGVKTISAHMKFHFGCLSKQPDILMDMRRWFIFGGVYQPKWNFISVKMTDMKSILAMSFKCTCALNAISNKFALINFASGKFCSHENSMVVWNFIWPKMTDTKSITVWVSFRLTQFMWTKVKSWLNSKMRDFHPKWNFMPVWVDFALNVLFVGKLSTCFSLCLFVSLPLSLPLSLPSQQLHVQS